MISRFRIENFALIEELETELFSGLSAVTGETGAGKSPVQTEEIEAHEMHEEFYSISEDAAEKITNAKKEGRRVISAFYDREKVLAAYRHAIENRYRFFSYGDAMLIL